MSKQNDQVPAWASSARELYAAYCDFILSRKAIMCRERTIELYMDVLGRVLSWMVQNGVSRPEELTAREVRAYLADMSSRGMSDSYINLHARSIRTLLLFWHEEKYIPERVKFKMPSIAAKQLRFLTAKEVQIIVDACETARDKALVLLMVDTGARRGEVCALNWQDVDIATGLIRIVEGKGGKTRSVVVGVKTRRALLAYRREVDSEPAKPLFQTSDGFRLLEMGVRSVMVRLSQKTGVQVSPHALRRTFATLSLKAGMNPLHLQALLGHTTLEMTRRYIQMVDDDLVEAHREYGPIDNILHKGKK